MGLAQTVQTSTTITPTTKTPATQLEEVIVTASRRTSTVLTTSGGITAVTGADIQARGFVDFSSFAQTIAGLSFTTSGPGQTEYELRGVSSPGGNSPTVGFYLDDTPLTAAADSTSGKVVIDPSLYDISRVEVLRGPQGTLYGSSSMGGAIRIITNPPDPTAYAASADLKLSGMDGGGFNHTESAMANLPLIQDKVALRIVGTQDSASGWIDRIVLAPGAFPATGDLTRGDILGAPVAEDDHGVNATDDDTVRAALLLRPSQDLSITPSVFSQHVTQGGPSAFDTDPGTLAHYEPYDIAEPYSENVLLGALNIQYHLGGLDVSSNTADFSRKQTYVQDATEVLATGFGVSDPYFAGPVAFDAEDDTRQFSQELRVASSGETRLKWLIGIFYSDLESDSDSRSDVSGLVPLAGTANLYTRTEPYSIKQAALFGETSYQFTPQLKATVGLRGYYYDTRVVTTVSGVASTTGSDAESTSIAASQASGANPKFDVTYMPSGDLTLYATVAKGFRPGGGNQPVPNNPATAEGAACAADLAQLGLTGSPIQYGPDSLWSYELGEKARVFNRRVSVNASAYMIDWSGIQQGVSLNCGFGYTANAGDAKIYGAELELSAIIIEGLELRGSVGYIDAHLTQGDVAVGTVAGEPLQTVPTWTTNLVLSYTRPLGANLKLLSLIEYNYIGERANYAYLALTPTPAYELTNARLGVTNGRWTASLFANNLFNSHAELSFLAEQANYIPEYNRAITNPPLTAGVDFSVRY